MDETKIIYHGSNVIVQKPKETLINSCISLWFLIQYRYQLKGRIPMNQLTLSDIEYSNRKKKTKREEFLDAM